MLTSKLVILSLNMRSGDWHRRGHNPGNGHYEKNWSQAGLKLRHNKNRFWRNSSAWPWKYVGILKEEATNYCKTKWSRNMCSFGLPRTTRMCCDTWTWNHKCVDWQVRLDPKDRDKTAFSIGTELWQFTVMPFRLCNAPATFEYLMENTKRLKCSD